MNKMFSCHYSSLSYMQSSLLFTPPVLSSALPSSCHPLIQELQDISTATVAVVNLEYDGSILPVTVSNTHTHTHWTSGRVFFKIVVANL